MEGPREYKYLIKRRDDDDTRWTVVPAADNPPGHPVPKSVLIWEFDKGAYYQGLEAHFQFCHFVKEGNEEKCFIDSDQINMDWAASIPDHVGTKFLTGTLRPGVPSKKSLYYGVWIVDPNGINDFAIGDNPPPKVETGG